MIPLLTIVGPTAVGKSQAAIILAREMGGEIVSADSRKVYKYMDIGTAKPAKEERREIPHHLLDLIEPHEEFSAGRFQEEAKKVITQVYERGNIPILVGGSGLYLRAVTDGLFSGLQTDKDKRRKLKEGARELGPLYLHERLKEVDPLAASRIHPHDLVRIIRALEIYEETGKPISSLQSEEKWGRDKLYNLTSIGLNRPRSNLYQRIEQRVDIMFSRGLVDEVKSLLGRGYHENLVSMQGLGYKEVCGYLHGRYDEKEAVRLLKRNTRRYAKRQLTWFKKDKRIQWIDVSENENEKEIVPRIKKVLANRGWAE
ncbi:tRNA (adenosine(37)-N6)-dimethylallyltransferase MiaA [candidate division NPL-UPA2 bacterium]|nr:tRNA (adenosine(37)-N6)-dimethylallyltransferase MiaA [candidate division NPL-UPA2 bacterium]